MRLIKRLIELAFVIFVISLFMKNKDVVLQINYFGLAEPITVAFWELVTICVSVGIIIAAVGDFITQLKWVRERRRMVKTDKEHHQVVDGLNTQIKELQAERQRLRGELEAKSEEVESMRQVAEAVVPEGQKEPPSEESQPEEQEPEKGEEEQSISSTPGR
jgi:type III secretory pathway component EscU